MTPHAILASALVAGSLNDLPKLRNSLFGVTGVYVIYCKVTGKYYIGSSYNIYNRVSDYLQPAYKTSRLSHPIIRAIKKYGVEQFVVLLLAETTRALVRVKEQEAINFYNPQYNQLSLVSNSKGYKHTETTKDLLRSQKKDSTRSQESRSKQSESMKGSNNHR